MRKLCFTLVCVALLGGCSRPQGKVLGKAPTGKTYHVISVKAGTTPLKVTISGVMIEKCPTAGCWFRLRDKSGVIKVDTKSAGFVVVNVPLDSKVTVSGKVVSAGDDVTLDATGIRF